MASDAANGGFRGFGSQALPFLSALKENNDRSWFASNKTTFAEELDAPFRELVAEVGRGLAARGSPVMPMVKNPVYRIYRDVRFSKDKTPYKTHLGASLHRGGDKSSPGLVYIHLEPAGSFLASGFYQPDPALLGAIRAAISEDSEAFLAIVRGLETSGINPSDGEPLTRMPKGFEDRASSPAAAWLRKRSFIVARTIADDELERRDLPATIAAFAGAVAPFLEFFWARIGPT